MSWERRIVFSATGNNSIPLSCTAKAGEGGGCRTIADTPLLIRGSLLSPVKITPAYGTGPTGHDNAGCTAASETPSWIIGGTQFNQRTIYNKEGASTSQSLSVRVTNNATGYVAGCAGFLTSGPGPMHLSCQAQEPFRPAEKYRIQTDALFYPGNLSFSVHETWFCDDTNPAAP